MHNTKVPKGNTIFIYVPLQLGIMIGFLSPIIVRSEDTNTVCSGNATLDQQHQWTETIYSQLLYWMSGQTAITFVLVILSLVGEIYYNLL